MKLQKRKSKVGKFIAFFSFVILLVIGGSGVYLGNYYHANMEAVTAFASDSTETYYSEEGNMIWEPEQASAGFIFYPGGKVEHTAYIPLMNELSSRGVLCVLVEMPFRLAVFDIDAAEGIQEKFPQIEKWYIGGHSLGGSMAASYLTKCVDSFEGLILLGSYSVDDLSDTELSVLSIYGSNDKVMNWEKYEQNKGNLPADFEEIIIDGGCHAYFGMYGEQEGDGEPAITNEEQIVYTADTIAAMVDSESR